MKVFASIFLLFSLQLALPVSSDTLSDLMYQFSETTVLAYRASTDDLHQQCYASQSRMNRLYQQNVIPSINKANKDIENYIADVQSRTTSSGYDTADCIQSAKEAIGQLPNVTEKANELLKVYNQILVNIRIAGLSNIVYCQQATASIRTQYNACTSSTQPQYCNTTLAEVLTSERVKIPNLMFKEVQRVNLAILREIGYFESRSGKLAREIVSATKPYLSLLESCVAAVLSA